MSQTKIPPNIRDEFQYIIKDYKNDEQTPQQFTFAIIKALNVYSETGNAKQAIAVKEAYRTAHALNDERLCDAGQHFAKGDMEAGAKICADVAEDMTRSRNTERDAVMALAEITE